MYMKRKTQALSTLLKLLEQLKIPSFIMGKWYQEVKSNV